MPIGAPHADQPETGAPAATDDRSAADVLSRVVAQTEPDTITIGEVMNALEHRGFGLLYILVALPNLPPIPMIPGVSTAFGLPMFLFALQLTLGRKTPYMPKRMRDKTFNRARFNRAVGVCLPYLRKVERVTRPSGTLLFNRAWEVVFGVFAMAFAISVAVPLPLTNMLPAYGVAAMGIGVIERDGRFMVLGVIIGLVGFVVLYVFWTEFIGLLAHWFGWWL